MVRSHDELLADCFLLCSLPVGSPERGELSRTLVKKWSPRVLWGAIQDHPEYFLWWLSVQSARLTELGKSQVRWQHPADSPPSSLTSVIEDEEEAEN
jgi:hypothetical protein